MDVIVETFGTWSGVVRYPDGTKKYSSSEERLNVTFAMRKEDVPNLYFEVRDVDKNDPFRIYVEPMTYRNALPDNRGLP